MEEKITIIIPVYKVEQYLDKCVESVVGQTYKNLEIILVDDGSQDNCPHMCDEWAKKDKRIKVIHKENGGLSDARNFGIDQATGEYLMFVDSDDYLGYEICEKLYKLLKDHKTDFSMCACLKFFENEPLPEKAQDINIAYFSGEEVTDQLYKKEIPYFMTAWGKLYKKELFKTLRYPKGRLHEDEFVLHEILANVKSFVYTDEQMYYYLQRAGSIMGSKKEKNIVDILCAYRNRYKFLNEKYPDYKDKTDKWYLKTLKSLYIYNPWISKQLKKDLVKEYKRVYKSSIKKDIKDKIFYYLPRVSLLLWELKTVKKSTEKDK